MALPGGAVAPLPRRSPQIFYWVIVGAWLVHAAEALYVLVSTQSLGMPMEQSLYVALSGPTCMLYASSPLASNAYVGEDTCC